MSFREGNGTTLQYSCLENPMDGGTWWAAVHGIAKSRTRLSDFTFTFHFRALEKEMATHSSVLAWRIPAMGEPGGLPSIGSHRVGHNWSDLAAAPWKESYDRPRHCIKKQKCHFSHKGPSSQSNGFFSHVQMWELDHKKGWALKNRSFWIVVLEKTLESPLDCKKINLSILKEITPEYSLEGLRLKLKLQYFSHLMQRTDSFEKTLMLGKIEGGRRRGWQRMRQLDGITNSMEFE